MGAAREWRRARAPRRSGGGGSEGAARERPPRQAALLASISAGAAEAGDAEQAASYIVQSRSHHFKQPAVTPVVRLRLTVAAGGCVQALVVTRSVCCYCGQRFGKTGCAARKQHERGCAGRRANAARADREAGDGGGGGDGPPPFRALRKLFKQRLGTKVCNKLVRNRGEALV